MKEFAALLASKIFTNNADYMDMQLAAIMCIGGAQSLADSMAMDDVLQNVQWCCNNFKSTYVLSRKKTTTGRPLKKEAHEGARLWSAMCIAYPGI